MKIDDVLGEDFDDILNDIDDIDEIISETDILDEVIEENDKIEEQLEAEIEPSEDSIITDDNYTDLGFEEDDVEITTTIKKTKSTMVETVPRIVEGSVDDEIIKTSLSLRDEQKMLRKEIKKKSKSISARVLNMMDRHFDIIDDVQETILNGNIHHQAIKAYTSLVDSINGTSDTVIKLLDKENAIIEEEIYEEGGGAAGEGGKSDTIIISSDQLIDVFVGMSKEMIEAEIAKEKAKLENKTEGE